jgi:hypothetical protein
LTGCPRRSSRHWSDCWKQSSIPWLLLCCNAPADDEPETGEEKQAVAEARVWLQRNGGEGIPHDEAMRRLGLE